jgi:hypothetical protein
MVKKKRENSSLKFKHTKEPIVFPSSSNGLPFEHLAHEEFRWAQNVAHFA